MMGRLSIAAALLLATLGSMAFATAVVSVRQKNRSFSAPRIEIRRGDTVRFTNEDEYIHQIFVHDPRFNFDSDEQAPGASIDANFTASGEFAVLCGIHPKMRLAVLVR